MISKLTASKRNYGVILDWILAVRITKDWNTLWCVNFACLNHAFANASTQSQWPIASLWPFNSEDAKEPEHRRCCFDSVIVITMPTSYVSFIKKHSFSTSESKMVLIYEKIHFVIMRNLLHCFIPKINSLDDSLYENYFWGESMFLQRNKYPRFSRRIIRTH